MPHYIYLSHSLHWVFRLRMTAALRGHCHFSALLRKVCALTFYITTLHRVHTLPQVIHKAYYDQWFCNKNQKKRTTRHTYQQKQYLQIWTAFLKLRRKFQSALKTNKHLNRHNDITNAYPLVCKFLAPINTNTVQTYFSGLLSIIPEVCQAIIMSLKGHVKESKKKFHTSVLTVYCKRFIWIQYQKSQLNLWGYVTLESANWKWRNWNQCVVWRSYYKKNGM